MFKVNVIGGGDVAAAALLYRPPSESLLNYLSNNVQNAIQYTQQLGNSFVNAVTSMYNRFNGEDVRNLSKMVIYNAGTHVDQNVVMPVRYEHLHMANLAMQRYILAQPDVDKLYKKGMCYGYADTHIPFEPDTYGQDKIEYGRVMDGVLQFENDEKGLGYIMSYSQDDTMFYDNELTTLEQSAILDTWDNVARMIANGIDPTDPLLEEL